MSVTDSDGRTIGYGYDANGNKTKTVSPDGRTIIYRYDAAGRLTGIVDGGTFTIGYDSLGRRSSLAYPNGDTTMYGYEQNGRLATLIHRNAKGVVIAGNNYALDKVGNRLSNATADKTFSYQYDTVYRLTQALSSTPGYSGNSTGKGGGIQNATQQQKEFYTYDPVGNRLSSDKTKAYVYNQGNQLVINGGTHTYDKNGNLVQRASSEGTTNYAWDYENRLVRVTAPDGTVVEFAYDPFGRRIAKKVTQNGTITSTRYFYDDRDILFEYDDTRAIGNRYTHGPGIDEELMVSSGKDKYFYHADGLGSVTALTDSTGRVVQTYDYDAFGNLKDQQNRVKQSYTYTGREWDKETGLYFYRARYYDPMEGRFISKDPIGFEGGLNLYAYAGSNPINFTDLSGLKQFEMTIWVGGGVGYAIIGGGAYTVTIRDLTTGQSTVYTLYAVGIGVGLPTFRGSSRPFRFNDDDCKKSDSFDGYGYIGGASAEVGGGVKVGGGIKIPNGPFVPGSMISWDRGGFDIGVSHSLTRWSH